MVHKGMTMNTLTIAATLSDDALLARVQVLAGCERQATVELVAHLAELDTRQVLVAEGYSLFSYCTRRLGLSEDAACTRIEVARAARRFPVILDRLAGGSLSLTVVRLLAPHLTAQNHEDVLAAASQRTRREVEALVAQLAPRPDVPSSVRKLTVRATPAAPLTGGAAVSPGPPPLLDQDAAGQQRPAAAAPSLPTRRPVVAPLAPERYQVQFTVGQETHDTLRRLQDLLRREIPNGDPAAIVARALTLLLQRVEKRKLAATSPAGRARPIRSRTDARHRPSAPDSRHIHAAVRRAVWERDGGQCAFVSKSGHRCIERTFLELHHRHPYALGGPSAVDNLALRCRRHNAYEAELTFGPFGAASVPERTEATLAPDAHPAEGA
jgi:5-methylcytosine-specific restriction endonuclease McrA